MLTFGRLEGEWIDIGNERTSIVQVSDDEVRALQSVGDGRPLSDLAKRLLASRGEGVGVQFIRQDGGSGAKIGVQAHRSIPVDRREIAISKRNDRRLRRTG